MNKAIVTALLALLLFPCCRKPRTESVMPDVCDLVRDLGDTDYEVWSAARKRLVEAGALSVDPLVAALKSPTERIPARAADVLSEIGKPAVLPLVEVLLAGC
jgi:HEAT repeat protein